MDRRIRARLRACLRREAAGLIVTVRRPREARQCRVIRESADARARDWLTSDVHPENEGNFPGLFTRPCRGAHRFLGRKCAAIRHECERMCPLLSSRDVVKILRHATAGSDGSRSGADGE
jgi:hypothetical protein